MRFALTSIALLLAVAAIFAFQRAKERNEDRVRVLNEVESAASEVARIKSEAAKPGDGTALVEYDAALRSLERLKAEAAELGAEAKEIDFRETTGALQGGLAAFTRQ